MAAPKTVKTYDLDGSLKDFEIPFEYLARKFVVVTLLGQDRKELVLNVDYRFTQRTVITTTQTWGPGSGYERIEIKRVTSATERLVDFSDGSILRASDLNTATVQALHIAEEGRDIATDTIGVDNDGNLDARGRKIVNLADASLDGDAVTLRQEKEWAQSTLGNRNAAEAAAAESTRQAGLSDQSRAESLRQANLSKASADAAKLSETSAANSARIATEEIAKIDGQVNIAKDHADRAGVNAQATAKDRADTNNLKLDAQRYAGEAGTSASAAAVSAKNASDAGLQLGMSAWGYRPQPFKGFIPDDGQELDMSLYPAFVQAIFDGLLPSCPEDVWQTYPSARGHFVLNSSPGKFRMRDLNGSQVGSIKGLFQRGYRGDETAVPGVIPNGAPGIVRDRFQRHAHNIPLHVSDSNTRGQLQDSFAFDSDPVQVASGKNILTGSSWVGLPLKWVAGTGKIIKDQAAADAPRTGDETSPSFVTGCWMTRVFGVITPLGSAEANSLATAYGSLAGRVGVLEARKKALGDGQDWYNLTAQRGPNTWWVNDTGRTIHVIVTWLQSSTQMTYFWLRKPDGTEMRVGVGGQQNVGGGGQLSVIVPTGYSYRLVLGNTYDAWFELR
ncbi:putative tail fiber protein [Pseudomonas phage Pf17397_F_PD1]|nr:putative tail fiber protein [Pseudomonas phage Pf17397_F_PD1]